MTGKRKAKRAAAERDDLSKPTRWRMQHGEFAPPSHDTDPETGLVVTHHRSVDTLGMMLANGTITQEMHDAGALFRTLFRLAAFGSMATSQLIRLSGKTTDAVSEHCIDARRRIAAAMDAIGGHDSAAGSCAWHILGLETSIREWAMRCGWGGRMVTPPQAQGMLVATLSVLARHFGLVAQPQAA
jgi:hypothetical protein